MMDSGLDGADDRSIRQWVHSNFLQMKVLREMDIQVNAVTAQLKRISLETLGFNCQLWNEQERQVVIKVRFANNEGIHDQSKKESL